MKYYLYCVICSDETIYTGTTNNVVKRIKTHNAGKGAKYTRYRRPVQLIFVQSWASKSQALRAEYAFKQLTRQQKQAYIKQNEQLNLKDTFLPLLN